MGPYLKVKVKMRATLILTTKKGVQPNEQKIQLTLLTLTTSSAVIQTKNQKKILGSVAVKN